MSLEVWPAKHFDLWVLRLLAEHQLPLGCVEDEAPGVVVEFNVLEVELDEVRVAAHPDQVQARRAEVDDVEIEGVMPMPDATAMRLS